MKCPVCNARAKVVDSRKAGKLVTRRRRACVRPGCGFRFTTKERVDTADTKALHELQEKFDALALQLTQARRGLATTLESTKPDPE